jgi:hypothetical protein
VIITGGPRITESRVYPNQLRVTSWRSDTKNSFSIQRVALGLFALRCATSWQELYAPRHPCFASWHARHTPYIHLAL